MVPNEALVELGWNDPDVFKLISLWVTCILSQFYESTRFIVYACEESADCALNCLYTKHYD